MFKETVKDGLFLLLIILAIAQVRCAAPQVSIASDLHSSAIAAQTTVRDAILPSLRQGGPDAQKIYSAATTQIFICRQKSIETLKTYALGKDEEAQALYNDAMALCTWKPGPMPPMIAEPVVTPVIPGPMAPTVTLPVVPVAP